MIWKSSLAVITSLLSFTAFYFSYALYSTRPIFFNTHIAGLASEVRVGYDRLGVPTILADSLLDAIRAQGYVTAKDRAFQMDLIRRKMKGTLAEVFGKPALDLDKTARFFNFSKVARDAFSMMTENNKALLIAYAEGANAWLKNHRSFESRLLALEVEAWEPADSLLVVLSMFQSLDRWENEEEVTMNLLKDKYPKEVVEFLTQDYGFFDAVPGQIGAIRVINPPGPNFFKTKASVSWDLPTALVESGSLWRKSLGGSGAWILTGKRTRSGKPVLSGDPHLQITVPNLWYRVLLKFNEQEIIGASIPGIPFVIIGTNGYTAWTFTNAYADTVDFVHLDQKSYPIRKEVIHTRFSSPIQFEIHESPWGSILEKEGKRLAVQWAALDPKALSQLDLQALNKGRTLAEATRALEQWSGPVQNCFIADRFGETAWLIVGRVPKRIGFNGRYSISRDGDHYWNGYLPIEKMPKILNPKEEFLGNENQRTAPLGKDLYQIANSWPSPARGYRLRSLLESAEGWDLEKISSLQLDTLSVVHLWYRDKLVPILKKYEQDPWALEIVSLIEKWDGRLTSDSSAYLFLKKWRLELFQKFQASILGDLDLAEGEAAAEYFKQRDEWIVQILEKRPPNWLPKPFKNYDEFLYGVSLEVAKDMAKTPQELKRKKWGQYNKADYRHPFSRIFSPLSWLLDLPRVDLNGDSLVLRVERPRHSASLRITVDLADVKRSLYSQPGGQSGHPLSPNYRDQFDTWYYGRSTLLYPDPAVQKITLMP